MNGRELKMINIIGLNLFYTVIGGCLAVAFMAISYKVLDKLTPYDTSALLEQGNEAVGRVVMGMFIGIGIAVGQVIGAALN